MGYGHDQSKPKGATRADSEAQAKTSTTGTKAVLRGMSYEDQVQTLAPRVQRKQAAAQEDFDAGSLMQADAESAAGAPSPILDVQRKSVQFGKKGNRGKKGKKRPPGGPGIPIEEPEEPAEVVEEEQEEAVTDTAAESDVAPEQEDEVEPAAEPRGGAASEEAESADAGAQEPASDVPSPPKKKKKKKRVGKGGRRG